MKTVLIVLGSAVGLVWLCMQFVVLQSTKRLRTGEEGKERATRLMVVLYSRGYNVKLYLAYLYDLVDVLFRRIVSTRRAGIAHKPCKCTIQYARISSIFSSLSLLSLRTCIA